MHNISFIYLRTKVMKENGCVFSNGCILKIKCCLVFFTLGGHHPTDTAARAG